MLNKLRQWYMDRRAKQAAEAAGIAFKKVELSPDELKVVVEAPALFVIAEQGAELLNKANAANYVEYTMYAANVGRWLRMTVQWAHGLSPAEKARELEAQLAQKEERYQQLFGFAREVFSTHFDGGVGDDDIEVMGRKHGLLEVVQMTEPCSEWCNCAGLFDEGEEWDCNRVVRWLWDGDTAVAGGSEQ
jgi:hypothetical protein